MAYALVGTRAGDSKCDGLGGVGAVMRACLAVLTVLVPLVADTLHAVVVLVLGASRVGAFLRGRTKE